MTGHRALARPDEVRSEVIALFDRLAGDGAPVDVLSSLAEGADRLVAEVGRERGGRLLVVLPLPADEFEQDFADEVSIQEFNELLAVADEVSVIDATATTDPTREAAYEAAGLAVLDRSDVLVALWDGEVGRGRGGTADLVAEARRRGNRVEVISVDRVEG